MPILEGRVVRTRPVSWRTHGADRTVSVALRDPAEARRYAASGSAILPMFYIDLDGVWESQDEDARFRLETGGGLGAWLERFRDQPEREILRRAVISRAPATARFTIVRPIDAGLARFQFAEQSSAVIAANCVATLLSFTATATPLSMSMSGSAQALRES